MANRVFLDTNGWLALINSGDALHQLATTTWRDLQKRFHQVVVTDHVVAETGNGLARGGGRRQFSAAANRLLGSAQCTVVYVDDATLRAALALFESRGDKLWGLVDCTSFIVMERLSMTSAFTTDRRFEQAGFSCLLPRV